MLNFLFLAGIKKLTGKKIPVPDLFPTPIPVPGPSQVPVPIPVY